jgi:nucleoside-diphosphate-sugar epimerase|tara:strand:- start:97 stop:990 length:894 start_codon:yes stop_codon:yes gene_type:complete
MKILITGGAGFFGSKLTETLLSQGHIVIVYDNLFFGSIGVVPFLDNKNYKFIKNTINNLGLIETVIMEVDYIIHLAAIVGEPSCKQYESSVYSVNTGATEWISECADKYDIPLLFLSTCSNYGKTDKVVTEDSPLEPLGLYADSKIKAEKTVLDNNHLVLRMSTLFGVSYRVRYDITINEFVYQYYRDRLLKVYGENTWRPYLHVQDACNMIIKCMENDLHGVYNAGFNDLNYQKKEIVNKIVGYLGEGKIEYVDFDDPRDYQVNFDKIQKEINYQYQFSLEDGIREVYEHIQRGMM